MKFTVLYTAIHHAVWYNHIPITALHLSQRFLLFCSMWDYRPGVLWTAWSLSRDCALGKASHLYCISLAMDNTHLFQEEEEGSYFFSRSLSCSFIMPFQSIWSEAKTTVFHIEIKESNLSSTTSCWQRTSWHAHAPPQHSTNPLFLCSTLYFAPPLLQLGERKAALWQVRLTHPSTSELDSIATSCGVQGRLTCHFGMVGN